MPASCWIGGAVNICRWANWRSSRRYICNSFHPAQILLLSEEFFFEIQPIRWFTARFEDLPVANLGKVYRTNDLTRNLYVSLNNIPHLLQNYWFQICEWWEIAIADPRSMLLQMDVSHLLVTIFGPPLLT
jgi:hypothetical protein